MGLRKLRSLIRGLPADALIRTPTGPVPWTFTEELQVATLTKIHDLLRVTHAAVPRRRGSHYRPIPPLRIPRPGENTKPKPIRPAAFFRMMMTGGD